MLKRIVMTVAAMLVATTTMAAEISGAGATFPYPIYAKWADAYKKETGNTLNYQSIGSGAGIKQILAKTVTFGASDMPLSKEELDKNGLIQFPTVIGGNVVVVNLDGVGPGELELDGATIADIYAGKITKWNDAKITSQNPKVKLPDAPITVVRRSDGSGTTYVFTKFLSEASADWAKNIGSGTAIEWPVGVGAKGNDGVAGNVKMTKNSIGYVEYAYAKQNGLAHTAIKGVLPGKSTFQSGTWPITAPTYIIMYKQPADAAASKAALEFFTWAYAKGDQMADDLDYVPLSAAEKEKIAKLWTENKLK
jgi:phosphate transport system substrate-binding protein